EYCHLGTLKLDVCYSMLSTDEDPMLKGVEGKGTWTKEEHERFLHAMEVYPNGPWKSIAEMIATRTIRQTQTHAQKYREKLERRRRGLRTKTVFGTTNLSVQGHYVPPTTSLNMSPNSSSVDNDFNPSDELDSLPGLPDCLDFLIELLDPVYSSQGTSSMASISLTPHPKDNEAVTLSPQQKLSNLIETSTTAPSTAASTPTAAMDDAPKPVEGKGTWTKEEHERFLTAMEMYPNGPWKKIAEVVKSRTIRQTQTHAQKYREKLERRRRGLRTKHVVQNDMALRPSPYIPPYTPQVDSYYSNYQSPYQHHPSPHHHVPSHPIHSRQYEPSYVSPSYHEPHQHYLPPPPVSTLPTSSLPSTSHYSNSASTSTSHYDHPPLSGSLNLLWDPINMHQNRAPASTSRTVKKSQNCICFPMLHLIQDTAVEGKGTWTKDEHERFLNAMEMFPNGPWKAIADAVGTRTIRQTQTHAQKYREKLARRRRGLRTKHILQPEELKELNKTPRKHEEEESGGWSDEGEDDMALPPLHDCLDFLIGVMERDNTIVRILSACQVRACDVYKACHIHLKMDTAFVIVDQVNQDGLVLYAQNDNCHKCALGRRFPAGCNDYNCTFVAQDNVYSFDTVYPWNLELRDENESTVWTLRRMFEDTANYTMNVQMQGTDVSVVFKTIVEPKPSYAFLIFGLFLVLWFLSCFVVFFYQKHKRDNEQQNQANLHQDLVPAVADDSDHPLLEQTPQKKPRVVCLDVFRGITIVSMIFTNLGGGGYWFWSHATWNGLNPADCVFPWFVWIMGVTMNIGIKSHIKRKVPHWKLLLTSFWRGIKLFCLGLLVNNIHDLSTGRIPGVLQTFAFAYFAVTLAIVAGLYFGSRSYLGRVVEASIIIIYALVYIFIVFFLPVPDCPTGYFGPGGDGDDGLYRDCPGGAHRVVDRYIFGDAHMLGGGTFSGVYGSPGPWDPEGFLNWVSASVLAYLGYVVAGGFLNQECWKRKTAMLVVPGVITGLIGLILCGFKINDGFIPINKNLWSVSFVLVTSALGCFGLAFMYLLVDKFKIWSGIPFLYAGMNAIVLYVGVFTSFYEQFNLFI
ncbi:heparan-alpha-glucosaminide N-acetyltransferase-like, partial [Thraustotheca clavata]